MAITTAAPAVPATVQLIKRDVEQGQYGPYKSVKFVSDNGHGLPKDDGATLWRRIDLSDLESLWTGAKVLLTPKTTQNGKAAWDIALAPGQTKPASTPSHTAPAATGGRTNPALGPKLLAPEQKNLLVQQIDQHSALYAYCRSIAIAGELKRLENNGWESPTESDIDARAVQAWSSSLYITACKTIERSF